MKLLQMPCVWIVGGDGTPPDSCARHLARRMESDTPFSPRLQQASIRATERIRRNELGVSGLDIVCWLNRLDVEVDDMVDQERWAWLLVGVIRFPTGPESLSSRYWCLLAKLVVVSKLDLYLERCDMEVMRLLEEAEDWEKLGVWMVVVWSLLPGSDIPITEPMEGIQEVTLMSLLRQLSAIPIFEDLCRGGALSLGFHRGYKDKLQRICDQARAEQPPLEVPPPPCVPVRSAQCLPILMPSIQAIGSRPAACSPSFCGR